LHFPAAEFARRRGPAAIVVSGSAGDLVAGSFVFAIDSPGGAAG
jgi:hypothetical protein